MSQEVHKKTMFKQACVFKFLKCFVVLTLWKQREKCYLTLLSATPIQTINKYIILFHISVENQIYEYVPCIICCLL